MDLIFSRLAVVALVGCSGLAAAQVDSTGLRPDSLAAPAGLMSMTPVAPEPAGVDSSMRDTGSVMNRIKAADSSQPRLVAGDVATAPHCPKRMTWALEGSVRYGWRMGGLLDQENDWTRHYGVALVGDHKDTTQIDPIASGVAYQAVVWAKGACGHQIGLGFQYAQLLEHPAWIYSASLSESLLEQMLLTARFRYAKAVTKSVRLFGEAALGWNHASLHRIPLAANYMVSPEGDSMYLELDQVNVAALHAATQANGVHVELGLGAELLLSPQFSIGLTVNPSWDRIWSEAKSGVAGMSYDASPSYWGFDIGLAVTREF